MNVSGFLFYVSKKSIVELRPTELYNIQRDGGSFKGEACTQYAFVYARFSFLMPRNRNNHLLQCAEHRHSSIALFSEETTVSSVGFSPNTNFSYRTRKKNCRDFRFIGAVKDMSDHIATSDSLPLLLHYCAIAENIPNLLLSFSSLIAPQYLRGK